MGKQEEIKQLLIEKKFIENEIRQSTFSLNIWVGLSIIAVLFSLLITYRFIEMVI